MNNIHYTALFSATAFAGLVAANVGLLGKKTVLISGNYETVRVKHWGPLRFVESRVPMTPQLALQQSTRWADRVDLRVLSRLYVRPLNVIFVDHSAANRTDEVVYE